MNFEPGEFRAVACNHATGTSEFSKGALGYVALGNPGGGHDRIEVWMRTRGGRFVLHWERIDRLTNFRLKTVMPGTPAHKNAASYLADSLHEFQAAHAREVARRTPEDASEGKEG